MERSCNLRPPFNPAPSTHSVVLPFLQLLCLMLIFGCGPARDGFRFQGRYEAAISGFDLQIVSEGYIEEGRDTARAAFAVVRICPAGRSNARAIRMTLMSVPGRPIEMEAEELGPVFMEWNSKTAEGLLRGLLSAANFRNIQPDELRGSVAVIDRSLAGPNAAMRSDQPGSLRVLSAGIEDAFPLDKDAPPREWISPSEVPACVIH